MPTGDNDGNPRENGHRSADVERGGSHSDSDSAGNREGAERCEDTTTEDTNRHRLPVSDRPQQTAREAKNQGIKAATVRYQLEQDITPGDTLVLTYPGGDTFATATVVDVRQTVARNAYPRIASRTVAYGCDSVKSLLRSLNRHYSASIRYSTPVTIIYYKVDVIAQEAPGEATDCRADHDNTDTDTDSGSGTNTESPTTESEIQPNTQSAADPHGDTHNPNRKPAASVESIAEGDEQVCKPVEDIAAIDDDDEVVMCAHVEEDIHAPWFFGFSDGELYRYHPYFEYTGDRKLIQHRSSYAIMSDDIVTMAVSQAVLAAYQHGNGKIPQPIRSEVRKRQSRQQSASTGRSDSGKGSPNRGSDNEW